MMGDAGISWIDMIAAGFAVLAAAELAAAQYFSGQEKPQSRLIASLLLWEAIAMFACAAVIYVRHDFGISTIVSVIAIWMAGAGVGLLRAGVFDGPRQ